MSSQSRIHPLWTFAIVSVALFMVVLDNLVVTTALPSIRADLGGGVQDLEWTVNAYTLSFAVLLLTGAALGPFVGGGVVEGISCRWLFGSTVPVGIALAPFAAGRLTESFGPAKEL